MNLEKDKEIEQLKMKVELLEKRMDRTATRIHGTEEEINKNFWHSQAERYEESPHGSIEAIVMDGKFLVPSTKSKVVVELPIKCEKKWKTDGDKIDCKICEDYDYCKTSVKEYEKELREIRDRMLKKDIELGKLEEQLTSSK